MIEVERKYRVSDLTSLMAVLDGIGATSTGSAVQHDQVFLPAEVSSFKEYKKGMPIVRVRDEDEVTALTLKAGGDATFTHEIETVVADSNATTQIISALSMHRVMEIRKSRVTYKLDELTIACDKVDGLGSFVEVELLVAGESDVARALQVIDDFAGSKLGLASDSIESRRYDVLIEESKAV